MKTRAEVNPAVVQVAIENVVASLEGRLTQTGRDGFISPHEILGIVDEEYNELRDAVRSDEPSAVRLELIDVAVAAIFGLASMYLLEPDPEAPAASGKS
jgi:hypothetical protein